VAGNSSWLSDGLKFKCTQCGKCCTGGRERLVWVNADFAKSHVLPLAGKQSFSIRRRCIQVSEQEAGEIAGSLGLEGDTFADRYLQVCLCHTSCQKAALAAKAMLMQHLKIA